MAERDRFELDLAAALRAYAEDAPTQVRPTEIARHFAAAYPHGRTAIGPWRLPVALRPAWVLLLLAALLAALLGGALLAGSQMQRRLPAVLPPVGQVFECPPGSTPDEPGSAGQTRPPRDGMVAMAFDRRAGKLVGLAGFDLVVETWTFDVCSNTWTQMHPKHQPSGDDFDDFRGRVVYDVDSDVTIAFAARVWAYDLEANTWTEKGRIDLANAGHFAYDPRSGLVVAAGYGSSALWSYEVEADTWTPIHQAEELAVEPRAHDFNALAYDVSVDRLVAYGNVEGTGPETRLLDLRAGTWSGTGAEVPEFAYPGWRMWPAMAYDEAAERTVLLGQGHSSAYDAAADRWETLSETPSEDQPVACGTRPECRNALQMVYDAVNRRLVVYEGVAPTADGSDWVSTDDVLAFDTRAREWTVLLGVSEGQPAPSLK